MIAVDTNLIAYLYVGGKQTPAARAALDKDGEWIAPRLWRSELRNILARYVRRGEFTLGEALDVIDAAEELLCTGEYEPSSRRVMDLAIQSGCTAYDCEFVGLALDLGIPLVTWGREILQRFPSVALSPEDFTAS